MAGHGIRMILLFSLLINVEGFLSICHGCDNSCAVVMSTSECEGQNSLYCGKLLDYIENDVFWESCSTVLFSKGQHKTVSEKATTVVSNRFYMTGSYPVADVIITGLTLQMISKDITFENITMTKSTIWVMRRTDPYERDANIIVKNCVLLTSTSMILTDVDLSIRNSKFLNSKSTALVLYSSIVTFQGIVSFINNSGNTGGALTLVGTTMMIMEGCNLLFHNNRAKERGGAIFVDNSNDYLKVDETAIRFCFYILDNYSKNATYNISFIDNTAEVGGDHIYGGALKGKCASTTCTCQESYKSLSKYFLLKPNHSSSVSAISSNPTRICTCSDSGIPQCANLSEMFQTDFEVYPGAPFRISAVIVGGDFGTTTGVVYAHFVHANTTILPTLNQSQYAQLVLSNKQCTSLNYTVYSPNARELLYLTVSDNDLEEDFSYIKYRSEISSNIQEYNSYGSIQQPLLNGLTFINITLLKCPPGFVLTKFNGCDCYPQLTERGFSCSFKNGKGYISWKNTMWIGLALPQTKLNDTDNDQVIVSKLCPLHYCKEESRSVDLRNKSDLQCDYGHSGTLCGKCKQGLSLAIGSVRCIRCQNSHHLALILFFAAAGVLLIVVIAVLNLTVTQGKVNGLIFYANVVWSYQVTLFPPGTSKLSPLLTTFIAWLNLDFGIETCFVAGLNAFHKSWLQFLFPIYTAILFLVGLRYSSKLSKIFGDRSVPTLATLLFLSYTKLLRTIIEALSFVVLTSYPNKSATLVWSTDGNLRYGHSPHIFLLLTAIACLILLWFPYTILLFSMQWLRKVDHYRPLRIIGRYKPLYDAYFAPLRDRHHYWFGALLLAQCAVLIMSAVTYNAPSFSLIGLILISVIMLCYLNCVRVYTKRSVMITESSFLINLLLLVGSLPYFRHSFVTTASISVAFLEFCIIIIWNIIPQKVKMKLKYPKRNLQEENNNMIDMTKSLDNLSYIEYHNSDSESKIHN